MLAKGNPNWKKGVSGNPKGRKPGRTINDSIRKAVEKAAKQQRKTVGEYLWDLAQSDTKLRAKLVDKFISDAPKDVNLTGNGAKFIVVTKGEVEW